MASHRGLALVAVTALAIATMAPVNATRDMPPTGETRLTAKERVRALTPAPGRLVRVPEMPGRQHLWCRGRGAALAPTVVVISGAGDYSLSWRQVQSRVAPTARICTYDRAGLGWSSASPRPRTGRVIVAELTALLEAAGVTGPLVLAAHSMGGVYARMFAARHLARVRGVVLIDPGDEHLDVGIGVAAREALHQGVEMAAEGQIRGGRVCVTGAYARNLHSLPLATVLPPADARTDRRLQAGWCRIWRTNAQEGRAAATTWAQARREQLGRGSLGSRPVSVVASDTAVAFVPDSDLNERIVANWRTWQYRQRLMSSRSRFMVARGSSHLVMLERPGLVARQIAWVLRRA